MNSFNFESRRETCPETGKVCLDMKTAQTKKNILEKRGKAGRLRIYHCPHCNWQHLTKAFAGYEYNKK